MLLAMHTTITGMKSGGYYDAHSLPQREGMLKLLPRLLDNLEADPLQPGPDGNIRMLDIGSSQGGNAIVGYQQIIDAVRSHTEAPIETAYSDLPTNDYNQLCVNLYPGETPVYRQPKVYVGAVPGSAYERLVPDGSLQIATTFNMLGWMSGKPETPIKGYIAAVSPTPWIKDHRTVADPEDTAPYHALAEGDMKAFLRARAAELAPGGRLFMQCFGSNGEIAVAHGMIDGYSDTLLDLIDEGAIPEGVYEAFNWPAALRTHEEMIKPLETEPDIAEAYTLEYAGWQETPVSFNDAFKETGDVETWSEAYATFVRAFSEAVLAPLLPDAQRAELLDTFYARLKKTYASDPERYGFHYISVAALLRRN